ncbi:MAG: 4Fe-4S dicluster domain-containing protein, partial [Phycisphaerales bacterium]|nr:4Fe-4S dicluster domain-containing protein [Phycisphaerales bacterium]
GAGLAVVHDGTSSPTRDAEIRRLKERWPSMLVVEHDAARSAHGADGAKIAFDANVTPQYRLDRAKVLVSFGRDLGAHPEPDALVQARQVAASRRMLHPSDEMSRIFVVESAFSGLGSLADHRMRVSPTQMGRELIALGRAVMSRLGGSSALATALANVADVESSNDAFIEAMADDLVAARREALVVVGDVLDAPFHALGHAINHALQAIGSTVTYLDGGSSSAVSLQRLIEQIRSGTVHTVVCLGVNPVYDARADLKVGEAFGLVTTVTLSVGATETAAASTWSLPGTHYLEQWGDTRAHDGTISPIQPMIAPLYHGWSDIELLAYLAGDSSPSGYERVRTHWRTVTGRSGSAFEASWRKSLHDGVLEGTSKAGRAMPVNLSAIAQAVTSLTIGALPSSSSMDVVFDPGHMYDGRFANNPWMQELPQMGTRVAWDNCAVVSPSTAKTLGLHPAGGTELMYTKKEPEGKMATLSVGGSSLDIVVWVCPGVADDTVVLLTGYGREVCGRVGDGVGFNTFRVCGSNRRLARGAALTRRRGTHQVASTQNHWSLESRTTIVREVDLAAYRKYGTERVPGHQDLYGNYQGKGSTEPLNFAERLGEMSHAPENIGIYANPLNKSQTNAAPGSTYASGSQWGMTIDMQTCTGCGACTVACQAENNIPVVGKKEVAKGREMQWIRVDRYFTGDDLNEPASMVHQPVACVHCENAPCETVCPVNATSHSSEGLNDMVYNRCIGTRYCANNCPYKVRRFNFFDYGVKKVNGDYVGMSVIPNHGNPNLIPPRLRARLDEISKMQKNPDVTVRSRGVMEKCTYCVQRINEARVETRIQDLGTAEVPIPDGFFQAACQQACPTDAITFGNILDASSKVSAMRDNPRSYMLLRYLNTRPRTSHMIRVVNRNPALATIVEDPFHHGHGDGHGDDHGDTGHGDTGHGDTGHGDPGHGDTGHGDGHSFVDPSRRREDTGYALSLKVLGVDA